MDPEALSTLAFKQGWLNLHIEDNRISSKRDHLPIKKKFRAISCPVSMILCDDRITDKEKRKTWREDYRTPIPDKEQWVLCVR